MHQLTEIERYQDTHFNHLGQRLDVDNVIGPETRWSMDFDTLSSERRLVTREAQRFLGLTEDPPKSNSDPEGIIKGFLTRCKAKPGDPWCASGLSHCISVVQDVRIAGAINLGRHFPATDRPWVGDIYWFPTNDKGNGHCGLVLGVGSKEVMGIEFNVDNVCKCVRRPRAGLNFSRVFDEILGICPKVILDVPYPGGGTR